MKWNWCFRDVSQNGCLCLLMSVATPSFALTKLNNAEWHIILWTAKHTNKQSTRLNTSHEANAAHSNLRSKTWPGVGPVLSKLTWHHSWYLNACMHHRDCSISLTCITQIYIHIDLDINLHQPIRLVIGLQRKHKVISLVYVFMCNSLEYYVWLCLFV